MSKAGRHIMILTPGFPADREDTSCIPPLQQYLRTYRNAYPEDTITVIAFQYPYERKCFTWEGINVYSAGGRNNKFPVRLLSWKRVLSQFKKIHQSLAVDVIHSFWLTEATLIGQRLSRHYQIPQVATLMGQDAGRLNPYLPFINLSEIRSAAISQPAKSRLTMEKQKRMQHIIPFGESRMPRPMKQGSERDIDVLGVGSIVPVKNFSLFIRIIAEIKRDYPNLKSVIAGDQSDQRELKRIEKLIRDYGLDDHVALTGKLPFEEVQQMMERAKVLLHTAIYEGQAVVFGEALYNGAKPVTFAVGHTFPQMAVCADAAQMTAAVKKILSDKDTAYTSCVPLSMEYTIKAYHALYQ